MPPGAYFMSGKFDRAGPSYKLRITCRTDELEISRINNLTLNKRYYLHLF
jgi:hypothetical protein